MFAQTRKQWREAIQRIFKPKPKAKHQRAKREPQTFLMLEGDRIADTIKADTKSDARAEFKRRYEPRAAFFRSDKDRLPERFRVVEQGERIREQERQAEKAAA